MCRHGRTNSISRDKRRKEGRRRGGMKDRRISWTRFNKKDGGGGGGNFYSTGDDYFTSRIIHEPFAY